MPVTQSLYWTRPKLPAGKLHSVPVVEQWIKDMGDQGVDGAALIEEAKGLIEKHGG
jgi:hypothetical protein